MRSWKNAIRLTSQEGSVLCRGVSAVRPALRQNRQQGKPDQRILSFWALKVKLQKPASQLLQKTESMVSKLHSGFPTRWCGHRRDASLRPSRMPLRRRLRHQRRFALCCRRSQGPCQSLRQGWPGRSDGDIWRPQIGGSARGTVYVHVMDQEIHRHRLSKIFLHALSLRKNP